VGWVVDLVEVLEVLATGLRDLASYNLGDREEEYHEKFPTALAFAPADPA